MNCLISVHQRLEKTPFCQEKSSEFNTWKWTKQVGKWGGLDEKAANSGRLTEQFGSFERHFRVLLLAFSGFSCGSEVWELTLRHHERAVLSTPNSHSLPKVWKTRPLRAVGKGCQKRRNGLFSRQIEKNADFCAFRPDFQLFWLQWDSANAIVR